jgi:hypothetical protein
VVKSKLLAVLVVWIYCISHRAKVKGIGRIIRNMLILRLGKTRDIWHPEPEYEGHRDRGLYSTQNQNCPKHTGTNWMSIHVKTEANKENFYVLSAFHSKFEAGVSKIQTKIFTV